MALTEARWRGCGQVGPERKWPAVARSTRSITIIPESEPMIIGKAYAVKINANIGNSAVTSSIAEEVDKMVWATRWGADTIMDLSTGSNIQAHPRVGSCPTRRCRWARCRSIRRCGRSTATRSRLTWECYPTPSIEQAEKGVDSMTVHSCVLLRDVRLTINRVTGIVDRGGSIMAAWMIGPSPADSFLYTHFDDLCEILRQLRRDLSRWAMVCGPARSPTPTTQPNSPSCVRWAS